MLTNTSVRKLGGVEAMKPSEMRKTNGATFVCMGPSGAGKTSLLGTLHNTPYAPVAVADVDLKAHVLRDYDDIDVYPCHEWNTLDAIVIDLVKQSLSPYYKTFVVDGTTMMQIGLAYNKYNVNKISNPMDKQRAYGQANSDVLDLGQRLRVLSERGLNLIYNIWSVNEKEEGEAMVRVQPDLTPTMLTRFLGVLDFVVYLEPNAPPKMYPPVMRTRGSLKYATRMAISPDSPLAQVPPLIYNPSWASILDTFHGKPWPTEKHGKQA